MFGWLLSRFGGKTLVKYGAIALAVAGLGFAIWHYGDVIEERMVAQFKAQEWKAAYEDSRDRHEKELRAVSLASDQKRLIHNQESEIRHAISNSEDGPLAPVMRDALERMRDIEHGQDKDAAR